MGVGMGGVVYRGGKRWTGPLELELQEVLRQTWVRGTELRSCARAASALN